MPLSEQDKLQYQSQSVDTSGLNDTGEGWRESEQAFDRTRQSMDNLQHSIQDAAMQRMWGGFGLPKTGAAKQAAAEREVSKHIDQQIVDNDLNRNNITNQQHAKMAENAFKQLSSDKKSSYSMLIRQKGLSSLFKGTAEKEEFTARMKEDLARSHANRLKKKSVANFNSDFMNFKNPRYLELDKNGIPIPQYSKDSLIRMGDKQIEDYQRKTKGTVNELSPVEIEDRKKEIRRSIVNNSQEQKIRDSEVYQLKNKIAALTRNGRQIKRNFTAEDNRVINENPMSFVKNYSTTDAPQSITEEQSNILSTGGLGTVISFSSLSKKGQDSFTSYQRTGTSDSTVLNISMDAYAKNLEQSPVSYGGERVQAHEIPMTVYKKGSAFRGTVSGKNSKLDDAITSEVALLSSKQGLKDYNKIVRDSSIEMDPMTNKLVQVTPDKFAKTFNKNYWKYIGAKVGSKFDNDRIGTKALFDTLESMDNDIALGRLGNLQKRYVGLFTKPRATGITGWFDKMFSGSSSSSSKENKPKTKPAEEVESKSAPVQNKKK